MLPYFPADSGSPPTARTPENQSSVFQTPVDILATEATRVQTTAAANADNSVPGSKVATEPKLTTGDSVSDNFPARRGPVTSAPANSYAAPAGGLGSSFVYPPAWRQGQIPKFPHGKNIIPVHPTS